MASNSRPELLSQSATGDRDEGEKEIEPCFLSVYHTLFFGVLSKDVGMGFKCQTSILLNLMETKIFSPPTTQVCLVIQHVSDDTQGDAHARACPQHTDITSHARK